MTKNQTNKTEKVEGERPQEINTMKKVNLSTTIMSNVITFFVTLVLTAIGMWFLYENIQSAAHQNVVQDMQLVKATVEPLKK